VCVPLRHILLLLVISGATLRSGALVLGGRCSCKVLISGRSIISALGGKVLQR
jgi:hypothetical protein